MNISSVRFNPYTKGFDSNPYGQFRELRETDPVHRSFMGVWVLTRYADISRVLRDPNFSSAVPNWEGFCRRYGPRESVRWLLSRSVLNTDPPLHTKMKKALTSAFGPAHRAELQALVREIALRRIEALKAQGADFDAIDGFALPVPVETVSFLYRVAEKDRVAIKRWSTDVSRLIEPLPSGHVLEDAEKSIAEFRAYLSERLREPADWRCFPGRMAGILESGEMDEEDVLANLILMFPAGHETTVNLIGNGLHALLSHPPQLSLLRREPELMERAIEEILRFEPPQQVVWRSALSDCEIGGRAIAKGQQVMALLGAANRDPEAFDDPETFDITRSRNPHLSFGANRHACLGSWFARMQGAVALETLLHEFHNLRFGTGFSEWHSTMSFHGLKSLPLRAE